MHIDAMTGIGGNRGVLLAARALRDAGVDVALALVTHTEGSTYRKAGALALVAGDGRRIGTISGGCLEPAMEQLAREALAADAPRLTEFDTRGDDDLLFGSGSGCRGRMQVLAWPLPARQPALLLDTLMAAATRGEDLDLRVVCTGPRLGDWWPADSAPAGAGDSVALRLRAWPRLCLLGAGPEAPPLLRLARTLGWQTTVADHRPGLHADGRLADADTALVSRPAEALATLAPLPNAVLLMTHLASADLEALRACAALDIGYVGLLGPPARRDELLAALDDDQRARLRPRLRAPVGLFLGGDGPEAIALAIGADLQRHFHALA